jgi:hypothetical protein
MVQFTGGRRLVGVAAVVLGSLVVAPAGATPVQAPPPADPTGTYFDDGGYEGTVVPVDDLEGQFGLQVPDDPVGSGEVGAAGVEGIQPGDGFTPFDPQAFNWGGYRIELVDTAFNNHNVEELRGTITQIAAQLTNIFRVHFDVAPGRYPRPSGHAGSLFPQSPLDPSTFGRIRIELAIQSPCGTLVGYSGTNGAVGCGGPESLYDQQSGDVFHTRGGVWLSPSLLNANGAWAPMAIAHELGHALGLDHFADRWPPEIGPLQLMYPNLHGEAPDIPGSHYRTGDRNGLWYLNSSWYISSTYRDFLGRLPDFDGYTYWSTRDITAGDYVTALSSSDEWIGRIIAEFYAEAFGRAPDPSGAAFWTGAIRRIGVPQVAAQLYGSNEYFTHYGSSNLFFVDALYQDLLGRASDVQGRNYWAGQVAVHGRAVVAYQFVQSLEARRGRVQSLYCTLLDRAADEGGLAHWSQVILTHGDLALAANLATSDEYFGRADDFALRSLDNQPPLAAPCAGF